jgi:hypothetical protein
MKTTVIRGVVWLIVSDKAKEIFSSGTFELYLLYPGDTESLVELYGDIEYAHENGIDIGIEVGKLVDIIKQLTND